ncbi:MAG: M48 family metalloprotease [Melioribacteraceae bacterium]|nr:MAG: M48 family metalloprotease [Melioribacteraceae bacterium]
MKSKIKILIISVLFIAACGTGINLFKDSDEVAMGQQFDGEIRKNEKEYPVYNDPELKKYVDERIFQEILKSPEIKKKSVYNYKLEIIDDDSVLNAFAVPGGYVYLYTGLMKYLDSEAALAGVLGHEIAHVERRHATQRITAAYGIQIVASLALGNNPSQISVMAANLFGGLGLLANSRSNEDESDQYSIKYLQATRYYPGSVKFFFEKLRDDGKVSSGGSGIQTFLSTHPDPIDRINSTNERLKLLNLPVYSYEDNGEGIYKTEYSKMIRNRIK